MADKRFYEQSDAESDYSAAAKKADRAYFCLPGVGAPHKKPRKDALTGEQNAACYRAGRG